MGRTLPGSVGEPATGAGPEWALRSAEEARQAGETTENLHDLAETGGRSLEDILGPHPSDTQALVDAGGGAPLRCRRLLR